MVLPIAIPLDIVFSRCHDTEHPHMIFTEEQNAFRESVRRMAEKHVAPIAAEIDENDRFPEEIVRLFGKMGLMQLWVPEKYGGPNGNLTMVCIAREEISRFSPACGSIAGLNTMFIMPLLHFGSEEQRQRFLPILAKKGVVTAIALSEPQAGSDVSAMTTRAVRDGGPLGRDSKNGRSHGAAVAGTARAALSARERATRPQRERRRGTDRCACYRVRSGRDARKVVESESGIK